MEFAIKILMDNNIRFEQRVDDPYIIVCKDIAESLADSLRKAGYVIIYSLGKTVICGSQN